MVFYSNFFESEAYHKAYYASISALERWELVTKQRQPWYIWSGWFILWVWTWSPNNSDWWSDKSLSWFSYLWSDENTTSVFRTVDSRTTRIPASWQWDIEWTLSTGDSKHYNKMDYENAEVFLLYFDDKLELNPYTKIENSQLTKSSIQEITWEIRLPGLLRKDFGGLNTSLPLAWTKKSMPSNDSIVDRQIRWNYTSSPFTIYSTQKIEYAEPDWRKEMPKEDSVIREWDINNGFNFRFWNFYKSPFTDGNRWSNAKFTIISQSENDISNTIHSFNDIFINDHFTNTQLRFSLLNLLQVTWTDVYPFLEYYADFGWNIVPDKYYTIDGEWNFKDYQINTIVQKPTVKETILWSFTSIFW